MNLIGKVAKRFSMRARAKRAEIFRNLFALDENTKVLDLGSEDGCNINAVLKGTAVRPANIYIADIDPEAVAKGSKNFGFTPVVVNESGPLPFPDGFFDIVYCSSVIEHVTVAKKMKWRIRSGGKFREEADKRQKEFAEEIKRLGKRYFVQTPYRHFPVESHSLLPFMAWLPRPLLMYALQFTNLFWVKKTSPDWRLLDRKKMHALFGEARIIDEKMLGLTKSIMAVYGSAASEKP